MKEKVLIRIDRVVMGNVLKLCERMTNLMFDT